MSSGEYQLYVMDVSYYSGKMETYMRYKELDFQRIEPDWNQIAFEILPNTGLMKVPVIRTPQGRWLKDSSPMIEWLETQHREHSVFPEAESHRFFCRLLEDYADEWLWRPAMYFRWRDDLDADYNAAKFRKAFLRSVPMPDGMARSYSKFRQRRYYLEGDGLTRDTEAHIRSIYTDTLKRMTAVLTEYPYLSGHKPSFADFGFMASMFRHFSIDPTPAKIMQLEAPAVYEWVARMWNSRGSKLADRDFFFKDDEALPAQWSGFVEDAATGYLKYLHANALAFRAGRETFDVELQGVPYRKLPVFAYRVWCREYIQDAYHALSGEAKSSIKTALTGAGAWDILWQDGVIRSDYYKGEEVPFCKGIELNWLEKSVSYLLGTHWQGPFRF